MDAMTDERASCVARTVIEGLKYMPSHEWTKVEGDIATVGISDHAQVRRRRGPRSRRTRANEHSRARS